MILAILTPRFPLFLGSQCHSLNAAPRLVGWLHLSSGNCQKNRQQLSQAIASSLQSYWEQMGKASCVQLGSWKSPIAINRGLGGDGESECHTCCDKGPNFDQWAWDVTWLWLKLSETLNQNKKLLSKKKKWPAICGAVEIPQIIWPWPHYK